MRNLGTPPTRRVAKPVLLGVLYATPIAYPRYFDPITRLPCPVEVVVERLNKPKRARHGAINRIVSKLQGLYASRIWP